LNLGHPTWYISALPQSYIPSPLKCTFFFFAVVLVFELRTSAIPPVLKCSFLNFIFYEQF
jgi:hypothetical protein